MMNTKSIAFGWTDEEWSILEQISEEERVGLCMRAMFQHRSLVQQAEHEGLTQGGRTVRHAGRIPRSEG